MSEFCARVLWRMPIASPTVERTAASTLTAVPMLCRVSAVILHLPTAVQHSRPRARIAAITAVRRWAPGGKGCAYSAADERVKPATWSGRCSTLIPAPAIACIIASIASLDGPRTLNSSISSELPISATASRTT